jgi:hypothetical protein
MPAKKSSQIFKLGDWVKIRFALPMHGRIVELRGPLGPGGIQIYRVRVERSSKPRFIEVREDQLVPLPAGG